MGPVRRYGDALAHVTVTLRETPPATVLASLGVATERPVRALHVDTGGAPAVGDTPVLRLPEDVGRAAAVNRAVAGLDAEVGWVAIADPHVEWGAGAIDRLLTAAATHPRAGLLGPRLRTGSGTAVASGGPLPDLGDLLRGRFPTAPVPAGVTGWLTGTCVLVRRTAWDSVDGYDPRYTGSGAAAEPADVDLGDRLGRAGWLAVGVPAAEATVHSGDRQGILDTHGAGLRRYGRDRHAAPARALVTLAAYAHRG